MAKRGYTTINNLSKAIEKELKSYRVGLHNEVVKITDEVMLDLVKSTKNDARVGKRKGKYRKSISSRVEKNNKYTYIKVWYVKQPEHRLAHLLNNGHVSKNGKFVRGDKHISKNEEIAIKGFEKKVEEAIKNGD